MTGKDDYNATLKVIESNFTGDQLLPRPHVAMHFNYHHFGARGIPLKDLFFEGWDWNEMNYNLYMISDCFCGA